MTLLDFARRGRTRLADLAGSAGLAPWRRQGAEPPTAKTLGILFGVGFFLLMSGWALITPMNGTDEYAQVVKAAATVRLENFGVVEHVSGAAIGLPKNSPITVGELSEYTVPKSFATKLVPCFEGTATMTPACQPQMSKSAAPAEAYSYVGNYNPIFYALVGWPSLFVYGAHAVYLMRLCTILINAVLLGYAARTVLESRRPRRAMLCLLTAATPMSLYFGAIVNPNGTEICAAMLVWSVLLHLATSTKPVAETFRSIAPRLGLGLVLLLNLRMLGPLWVALAAMAACWLASPDRRRALIAHKPFRWAAGLCALGAIGSLAWTVSTPMELISLHDTHLHFLPAARLTLLTTPTYLRDMLFSYGWAEAPIPELPTVLLTCALAVLIVPLIAVRKYTWQLLAMLAGAVLIPIVLQGYEMEKLGVIWQGRYLLPYCVGIVLFVGYVPIGAAGDPVANMVAPSASAGVTRTNFSVRAFDRWIAAFVAVAGLACLYWAVRRNANAVGLAGPLLPIHSHWAPPMTWYGAILPYVLGVYILLRAFWRLPETDADAAEIGEAPSVPRTTHDEELVEAAVAG